MHIELNCARCGSNRFSLEQASDELSIVKCDDCGHDIGTMAELKRMVADEVLKQRSVGKPDF